MELNNGADETTLSTHLRAALPAPTLPAGFRSRLLTRMATTEDPAQARMALEQDWQKAQAALRRQSVHLRWQTLLWLLGGAFAAGALTVAIMPWVAGHYGAHWARWVPMAVAGFGLLASWVGDPRLRRYLGNINFFGA
jgi:uncharacterized membrane protein YraQ (UPF0718 family)